MNTRGALGAPQSRDQPPHAHREIGGLGKDARPAGHECQTQDDLCFRDPRFFLSLWESVLLCGAEIKGFLK